MAAGHDYGFSKGTERLARLDEVGSFLHLPDFTMGALRDSQSGEGDSHLALSLHYAPDTCADQIDVR